MLSFEHEKVEWRKVYASLFDIMAHKKWYRLSHVCEGILTEKTLRRDFGG
jgi:hypothetical protein